MGIHTLSLDDDLMQKLDENTAARKKSKKVEELIRNWLDENPDVKRDLHILKSSGLTDNQRRVARKLIERGKTELNTPQWNNFVEAQGITRKDYKDKCFRAIVDDGNIPYESDGGKSLKSLDVECSCEAFVSVGALSKFDGKCPQCGRVIVKGLED